MQQNKRKPYSKYYGQGEPEWRCPSCRRPIPDEQDDLRCRHCEATVEEPAPDIDEMPMPWQSHLLQLQRHLHRAIGRTIPFKQILEMLDNLSKSNDETSSEK